MSTDRERKDLEFMWDYVCDNPEEEIRKRIDPKLAPWLKHYGKVPKWINYPDATMYELVRKSALKYPEKTAYEYMEKKVKYKDLLKQIDHTALCLVKMGVKEDDKVLICMPNCPQAIMVLYAANKIGAIATMVHPLSAKGEIEFYVNNCECSFAFTLDMFYQNFPEITDDTKLQKLVVSSAADELSSFKRFMYKHVLSGRKDPKVDKNARGIMTWMDFKNQDVSGIKEPVSAKKGDDGAVILYTGGTTGKSKGALLSNMSFNSTAIGMTAFAEIYTLGEVMIAVMPIFHGFGLCTCIHLPFIIGLTTIIVPRFTPESYAHLIVKKKANFIAGVPALYEHMIRGKWASGTRDLSHLIGIFCGGDNLMIESKQKMDKFLADNNCGEYVREGFGATECLTATAITPKRMQRPGSFGIPMPNVFYKIVEPGTENRMPYGEDGEICISAPAVMLEYYNEPKETAQTVKVHSDGLRWLHTGDIGCMDEDGFCYFKQRLKRMIVTSGYNVYPSQIENVLRRTGLVKESCVIGIPDEIRGSKVVAYVVLESGVTDGPETLSKLRSTCRAEIARYAVPREYKFVESLPRTKVSKIDYRAVEKMDEEERQKASQESA